ncbi:MAG: DUF535 family protein [Ramlibacter sp.]
MAPISNKVPGIWQGVRWAMDPRAAGGGTSRARLVWRALRGTLGHARMLKRWMRVVFDLHSRGIVRDLPGEYLRALRPYVHRGVGFNDRVVQLIDHADWMETAFQAAAFEQLSSGRPLVLAELAAPRGYDYMRLQLQQAPPQSPEGELLLTLSLQRSADVQHRALPVDAAVLAFSRFRVDTVSCMVIGGVRGQRHPVARLSPMEINQVLQGWKPSVLIVRVAQELARHWNQHLLGLNPVAHRLQGWTYQWNPRRRETAQRIYASYDALWEHFDARPGPAGWMMVPLTSDDKLAATALSPEKRARQTRRADYWIRTRNLLRLQFRELLQRPGLEARISRITESVERDSLDDDDDNGYMAQRGGFRHSADLVASHVLQTGPASLQ